MKKRISLTTLISILLVAVPLLAGCTAQESNHTTTNMTTQSTTSQTGGSLYNNVYKVTLNFTETEHHDTPRSPDGSTRYAVYNVTLAVTVDFPELRLGEKKYASGNFKYSGWITNDWENWRREDSYEGILDGFVVGLSGAAEGEGIHITLDGPSYKYFNDNLKATVGPSGMAERVTNDLSREITYDPESRHLFKQAGETMNFNRQLISIDGDITDYSGTLTLTLVRSE